MNPKLGETITLRFVVSDDTGAASPAGSTPTVGVFEDASDSPIFSPTPVEVSGWAGRTMYRVAIPCTTGNGFEAGKCYSVAVAATVGGVAAGEVILTFQVRSAAVDDVLRAALYYGGDPVAPGDPQDDADLIVATMDEDSTRLANLDATVSSRLAATSAVVLPTTPPDGYGIPVDGGTVSASPPPTITTFTATGAGLHAPGGGYKGRSMRVLFAAGPCQGAKYPITDHTRSGSDHTFTVQAMPAAPASGNAFKLV